MFPMCSCSDEHLQIELFMKIGTIRVHSMSKQVFVFTKIANPVAASLRIWKTIYNLFLINFIVDIFMSLMMIDRNKIMQTFD